MLINPIIDIHTWNRFSIVDRIGHLRQGIQGHHKENILDRSSEEGIPGQEVQEQIDWDNLIGKKLKLYYESVRHVYDVWGK